MPLGIPPDGKFPVAYFQARASIDDNCAKCDLGEVKPGDAGEGLVTCNNPDSSSFSELMHPSDVCEGFKFTTEKIILNGILKKGS